MSLRLLTTLFLVISVCAFPFFFTAGVGIFAIIWFRGYYEIIPIVFLSDVLYGVPLHRFLFFPYVTTLVALALVLISVVVRRYLSDDTVIHI